MPRRWPGARAWYTPRTRRSTRSAGRAILRAFRSRCGTGSSFGLGRRRRPEEQGACRRSLYCYQNRRRLTAPPGDYPTFTALRAYRDFLAARGARLLVLVLSTQPESLAAYRFCREQGIEARLFDVPPALRIPDEGHFNAAGNEAVAALVAGLLGAGPNGAGR